MMGGLKFRALRARAQQLRAGASMFANFTLKF